MTESAELFAVIVTEPDGSQWLLTKGKKMAWPHTTAESISFVAFNKLDNVESVSVVNVMALEDQ